MANSLSSSFHQITSRVLVLRRRLIMSTSAAQSKNMYSSHTYEDAITELNKLQSNAQVLEAARANRQKTALAVIPQTKRSLLGVGVQLEQLDSLNVIHVAGTKGKGMTCAFTESILRHSGLKTGFFSSPHLVAARERIRINGKPLTKEQFTEYFFITFNNLNSVTKDKTDLPGYFRFLTCMAFYVFLQEKVDVAIVEAGIGGTNDTTNILRKPVVVGITSLGLEHQFLLGDTLEEIARNKAGVMKEDVPAFTVFSQPPHILQLLKECAVAAKCPFSIVPPLDSYTENIQLSIDDGFVSSINASLAIHLANSFLTIKFPEKLNKNYSQSSQNGVLKEIVLPFHKSGLQFCKWPGRFQILKKNENLWYYVDGAHTEDSLSVTRNWFLNQTNDDNTARVLIFYMTGDRKAEDLMKPFVLSDTFFLALFCPLIISNSYSSQADNWSALESMELSMQKCNERKRQWVNLTHESTAHVFPNVDTTLKFLDILSTGNETQDAANQNYSAESILQEELLKFCKGKRISVLITGSLHLVGTFLSLLDPDLK